MAKKKTSLLSWLYVVGMALTVIGFCCPMFSVNFLGLAKAAWNGFKFINFKNSSFVTIGALFIIVGAIAGLVLGFVPVKNAKLLKLCSLCVSVAGGVILVIGFTTNGGIYKALGKGLLKYATYGFYLVIVGWVVSAVGYFLK